MWPMATYISTISSAMEAISRRRMPRSSSSAFGASTAAASPLGLAL